MARKIDINDINILPYHSDSKEYISSICALPMAVVLDSAGQGRYEILSALPVATLSVEGQQLNCSEQLPGHAGLDVFAAIENLIQKHRPPQAVSNPHDLPFTGGVLGFLGYPRLKGQGVYVVDNAFLGIYLWSLVIDHQQQRCILTFQPHCPDETRLSVLDSLEEKIDLGNKFSLLSDFINDMSLADYETAFSAIKRYIAAGDCYQVNLAQRFSGTYEGSPLDAYLSLRQQAGKPFSAYMAWEDKALLSLSPERFLQLVGDKVTTQPIKGTRPRGMSPPQDAKLALELQNSEKDRAENLMIVDLLRNDLGTICEYGSISVGPLFELQSFDNVHHLVSTVTGTLISGANALNLLKNCFPGGSITGAPKWRSMEIIEELESTRRDAYCGSVLYLGFDGRMDSSITIRTLFCDAGNIYCWAGGGIVSDSECAQEYRECFDKVQQLINILQNKPKAES